MRVPCRAQEKWESAAEHRGAGELDGDEVVAARVPVAVGRADLEGLAARMALEKRRCEIDDLIAARRRLLGEVARGAAVKAVLHALGIGVERRAERIEEEDDGLRPKPVFCGNWSRKNSTARLASARRASDAGAATGRFTSASTRCQASRFCMM